MDPSPASNPAPRRVPGRKVLAGLALGVAAVTLVAVLWALATPSVPDAASRRGVPVPGMRGLDGQRPS